MPFNQLSNQRILSIDAFRGITILVMIFVNELAGMRDIPSWMKHMPADSDAMSFVDVVFPAFLFIVGMAIPFAINSRLDKGDTFFKLQQHILFRTLGLLVLGFFLVNAESGYSEQAMGMRIEVWALLVFTAAILIWKEYRTKNRIVIIVFRAIGFVALLILAVIYKGENGEIITPRWWGILGLIGWAYLYSCIFYQVFRGNRFLLAGMIAVCTTFYAIGKTSFIKENSWLHWISSQSGNAAHTSIVLCGVVLSLIFFDKSKRTSAQKRLTEAVIFTAILFLAGYFLRPYYAISKVYATPTWCLYSAGFCCLVFALLYWLIDIKQKKRWTKFFKPAATNPLLTYILPDIIYYVTSLFGISLLPERLGYGWPAIIWSAFFAIAVMGIVILLNKIHVQLKL